VGHRPKRIKLRAKAPPKGVEKHCLPLAPWGGGPFCRQRVQEFTPVDNEIVTVSPCCIELRQSTWLFICRKRTGVERNEQTGSFCVVFPTLLWQSTVRPCSITPSQTIFHSISKSSSLLPSPPLLSPPQEKKMSSSSSKPVSKKVANDVKTSKKPKLGKDELKTREKRAEQKSVNPADDSVNAVQQCADDIAVDHAGADGQGVAEQPEAVVPGASKALKKKTTSRARKEALVQGYINALNGNKSVFANLSLMIDALGELNKSHWTALEEGGFDPEVAVFVDALRTRYLTQRRTERRIANRAAKKAHPVDPNRPKPTKLSPQFYKLRKIMRVQQPAITDEEVKAKFDSFSDFKSRRAFMDEIDKVAAVASE
jgi:hypothetical protein